MSHVEDIDIEITDLKALAAAVAELGAIYLPNQKSYAWFGRSVGDYPLPAGFTAAMLGKCEHAIRLPDCEYEIGVVPKPGKPGTHTLLADFWGPGQQLKKFFGGKYEKLKQLYGLHTAENLAKRKGQTTYRKKVNGGIKLCIAVQ